MAEDILISIQEKYDKARRLVDEDSKRDPSTEPYRSKYKAKSLLVEIKETVQQLMEKNNDSKFKTMLAVVSLHLGTISTDTEELSTGKAHLIECLEVMENSFDTPDNILISISAKNQLAILWSNIGELDTSKSELLQAEELYLNFIKNSKTPLSMHLYFDCVKDGDLPPEKELESLATNTKFYLAQVYAKQKVSIKAAIYCHETLKRQLENKEFEHIDWALNSATLSQFFMERARFREARHHLAAASYMLDQYKDNLKELKLSEEEDACRKEELNNRSADVLRCWSKYGIFLLEYSKILPEVENTDELGDNMFFDSLELTVYENEMVDYPVTTFEEARKIFVTTQRFLNDTKVYYNLETRASDYVEIIQDHCTLYKNLIMFETDVDRQCKMHKKRADMLEHVLRELNHECYMLVCRKVWYELGEIYHEMMNLKYLKLGNNPTPHALSKINHLIDEGIENFNQFLGTIKNRQTDSLPDVIPEELVKPVIFTHVYMGRLYQKKVAPDKRTQLNNILNSINCYKYVVNYCNKHVEAKVSAEAEYEVSSDMMELLKIKFAQMSGSHVVW